MRAPTWWRRSSTWVRRKVRTTAVRTLRLFTGPRNDLRQFVYLDEVALRSLMAARYGAEDVKIIESMTRSREVSAGAGADVRAPATAGGSAEGRYQSSTSRGRQVERQTTVQSMFKEFLDREVEHNSIKWNAIDAVTPGPEPFQLKRGDLIQVSVELSADPTYRIGAFIAEYSDMMRNLPDGPPPTGMDDVTQLSGLLERLMVGQIPIRAKIVGYESHVDLTNDYCLSRGSDTGQPVFLVATTELDQYWTDTRRVLFGDQPFTVLARVVADGPTNEWSPIKLFDMVRDIIPGMQNQLHELQAALESAPGAMSNPPAVLPSLHATLTNYATQIGVPIGEPAVQERVTDIAESVVELLPSATQLNNAFDSVDALAKSLEQCPPAGMTALELRATARKAGELDTLGDLKRIEEASERTRNSARSFLEVEIIAIYW